MRQLGDRKVVLAAGRWRAVVFKQQKVDEVTFGKAVKCLEQQRLSMCKSQQRSDLTVHVQS